MAAKLKRDDFSDEVWLSDPKLRLCKPATRGIWMDAICTMRILGEASITGTVTELAMHCRCTTGEMVQAIRDLLKQEAADICGSVSVESGRVTLGNGRVTLVCRRLRRIQNERENTRKRVERFRRKQRGEPDVTEIVTQDVNGDVTVDVTATGSPPVSLSPTPPNSLNPHSQEPTGPLFGDPEIPESLDTPEFREAWKEWIDYRRERRPKVTPIAARRLLARLSAWGTERAIKAIRFSIASSWQGVCEEKENHARTNSKSSSRQREFAGTGKGEVKDF